MKKYYILEESIQGIYPKVDYSTPEDGEKIRIACDFEKYIGLVNPWNIHLRFVLRYHAKPTDFLTTSGFVGTKYLVSDKARRVFESSNLMRHIFFDATVSQKDQEYRYSLLTLMNQYDLVEYIDYEKSVFREIEWVNRKGLIKIHSYSHYKSLQESAAEPAAFGAKIEKLVMSDSFDRSLDMFYLTPFGINVYVSEDLKNKLEESKITGIYFTDPIYL